MSLRHVQFPLKDVDLRDDVGVLGALVGEIIEEQAGEAVLNQVESTRRAAIRRRRGDPEGAEDLALALSEVDDIASFVHAYSVFFQVVNLAERVHRIRRRRDYLRSAAGPQPGGVEEALQRLASAGVGLDRLKDLLEQIQIQPVFTAHPTEATRRSILQKHLRIARRLVERLDPTLTPPESRRTMARIRSEITALWQTETHPAASRTVSDESEHVLFYLTEILYRVIPPFYEALHEAAVSVYGEGARDLDLPTMVRFGSWVGGDMDGNPNVGAETLDDALRRNRSTVLALYRGELEGLYQQLTQSQSRVDVSDAVLDRISEYEQLFPDTVARFPVRHQRMPYRRLIRLIQARLLDTAQDGSHRYPDASGFVSDIEVIAESLRANKGINAGLFLVERLIRRARTFAFHLVTMDVRQDSEVHRSAVGAILDDPEWGSRAHEERTSRLLSALFDPAPPVIPDDPLVANTLSVFETIRKARTTLGARAIGPYIISMSRAADDVLSVLALAKWAGLEDADGTPLDVAPLFETVTDLENAPTVLAALFENAAYRDHLSRRGDEQIVMIGYSDSGKDDGIGSARWALHTTQKLTYDVAAKHGVRLTLFHGRGGTISRGGGRIDRAISSAPAAYAAGRLRLTEQGEVINQRYGLRDIAERTIEQMFSPLILAAAGVLKPVATEPRERIAKTIAEESRRAYRSLIHEDSRFFGYFRDATPIDAIERMQIGSRPASRRAQQGIRDLRAIPWVFAWTQSRHLLTGWYGFGPGLRAAVDAYGEADVREAIAGWPYLNTLVTDVERDLAAADLEIAALYAELAPADVCPVFEIIAAEHKQTIETILSLTGAQALLEHDDVMRRSIELRNPYIDPLSMLQVELLGRWREGNREDETVLRQLVGTINGIAQGMQNTG